MEQPRGLVGCQWVVGFIGGCGMKSGDNVKNRLKGKK
jgi:hypothetical protein